MTQTAHDPIATARSFLARLRTAFDAATQALAQRCSANGRLGGSQLDAEQVASFELAWAAADLLAAEAGVASLRPDGSELDARLALLFAVEAGAAVLGRLEAVPRRPLGWRRSIAESDARLWIWSDPTAPRARRLAVRVRVR